ncbi:hypothetical protein K9M41_00865 [Candidatus Gracilibacteria bacterium]|nr:hypothetical protein [Candidatus Gracilibacteria bacterium]
MVQLLDLSNTFMWFSSRNQKKKKSRRSAFGGQVKTKEEVQALNERIKLAEQAELEKFEKEFENKAKDLWK